MGVNSGGKPQVMIEQLQTEVDRLQAVVGKLADEGNILKAAFSSKLNGFQLESIIHKSGPDSGPKVMNGLISFVEKLVEHATEE